MGSSSLYLLSVKKVVQYFDRFTPVDFRPLLTENMMFDVYWEMLSGGKNHDQIEASLRSDHINTELELKMLRTLGEELAKLKVTFRYGQTLRHTRNLLVNTRLIEAKTLPALHNPTLFNLTAY